MTEEQKKIIKALAYRVKATPKDDPEYENAVRLFEKLKKKYNVKDEDLIDTQNYEFRDHIDFKSIMIQLIVRRLKARIDGNDEFCFHSYRIFNGKKRIKKFILFFRQFNQRTAQIYNRKLQSPKRTIFKRISRIKKQAKTRNKASKRST